MHLRYQLILCHTTQVAINIKMQGKLNELKLSYQEFLKRNKSIANSQIEHYRIYDKIGEGNYGSIYTGLDENTNKLIAVKLVDLEVIAQQPNQKVQQIRKRLSLSQPQLMMKCNSENIVKCYDIYHNSSLLLLAIEYCDGPNLQKYIDNRGRISEDEAKLIMKQIINGVAELHRNRIIHRDLKADNIFSHNGVYKIGDLGFSKQMENEKQINQTTLGTITTMAPEVMLRKPYGIKADIWSIGIIFFQMIYGILPYDSKSANRMYAEIQSKKILNTDRFTYNGYTASKEVTNFLKQILVVDSSQRLSWSQLQNHSFFEQDQSLDATFRVRSSFNHQQVVIQNFSQQNVVNELQKSRDKFKKRCGEYELRPLNEDRRKEQDERIAENKRRQKDLYQWVQRCHLECLKSELILFELVEKIVKNELYDRSDRQVIQMLYLMLTRALKNMTPVVVNPKEPNEYIVQNLKKIVRNLYSKVFTKWKQFGDKLTDQENKISNIMIDFIGKIFSADQIQRKDRYLTGQENTDYTKEEQINFTFNQYIVELIGRMHVRAGINMAQMKGLMKYYVEINNITLEELKKEKMTFAQHVNKCVNKQ